MALAEDLERPPAVARPPDTPRRRWARGAAVVAWFVALALYVTWPLGAHMTNRVAGDLADPLETTWILGWGSHAIAHDPLSIFDGNMYHPLHHTLAFSENMLGLSIPTAPVFWLTNNALLQLNVVSLLMLVVSGVGMFLLTRTVTGDWRVALVAGTAYEVLPYRLGQFSHLHVAGHLLPWALLLLVVLHRRASPRLTAALAFVIALQWWTSLTGGAVMLAACGAWMLWLVVAEWKAAIPALVRIGVGVGVGMIFAAPVFLPYLAVRNNHPEFSHPPAEVIGYSATPQSYLYPPGARGPVADEPYDYLIRNFQDREGWWEKTLWPGFWVFVGFPVALAAAAVPVRRLRHGRRDTEDEADRSLPSWRRMFAGFGVVAAVGAVLSFGPRAGASEDGLPLPFMIFTQVVPGGLMRVPARFGVLTAAGVIVATALALSRVPNRWRSRLVIASMLVIVLEATPQILPIVKPPALTAAHRRLVDRPGAVLALPTAEYEDDGTTVVEGTTWLDAQHLYLSTANFRPIVNGYSAFGPTAWWEMVAAVQDLPSEEGFDLLRERDVRTVVVQTEMIRDTRWADVVDRLLAWPGVRRIDAGRGVQIFDISGAT